MLPPMLPPLPPPLLLPTTAAAAVVCAAAPWRLPAGRALVGRVEIAEPAESNRSCQLLVRVFHPKVFFARYIGSRGHVSPAPQRQPRQNSPHACLSLTGAISRHKRCRTMSAPYLPRRGTSPGQAAPQTVSSCRQRSGCSSRLSPSTSATPTGKSVRRSRQASRSSRTTRRTSSSTSTESWRRRQMRSWPSRSVCSSWRRRTSSRSERPSSG